MALDPDHDWKAMKKAGKRLFQRLGELRDIQVMQEWVLRLKGGGKKEQEPSLMDDPAIGVPAQENSAKTAQIDPETLLSRILADREQQQKLEARAALDEFDRKQWKQWSKSLPSRAARYRPGSAVFKHLALERWMQARELHSRAMRNRSQTALHAARIGLKRFRYIVENFLPVEHKAWSASLKQMQDLLGEIHDLDVLWATALSCRIFPDSRSRQEWHDRVVAERTIRLERYREKMTGTRSLWEVWRAGLPQGKQVHALALRRIKLWAAGLDPDFSHSERVTRLALELYDGLLSHGWQPASDSASARLSLLAASLLHDIGKSLGEKGHHKASIDLIHGYRAPLGWSENDLRQAAIIARFHRGALPTGKHRLLRDLRPDQQKAIIQLSAILRLANAFDSAHDGRILRLELRAPEVLGSKLHQSGVRRRARHGPVRGSLVPATEPLTIAAEGYSPSNATARAIAAERHLLETVLRRPVIVKAAKHVARR